MSLTQIIADSLKHNIVNGAGFWRSPDGIFEATWLPDERVGHIDVINPNDKYNFKDLKTKALKYIKHLPKAKWQFNPDTTQKGNIYGNRIFKGMPNVKPNPNMPHKALTIDTTGNKGSTKGKIMKVIPKTTPKPSSSLKVGAGGSNTYSKQLNSPGKFGFDDEVFNHMNLENYHKIVTPGGVFPRV